MGEVFGKFANLVAMNRLICLYLPLQFPDDPQQILPCSSVSVSNSSTSHRRCWQHPHMLLDS